MNKFNPLSALVRFFGTRLLAGKLADGFLAISCCGLLIFNSPTAVAQRVVDNPAAVLSQRSAKPASPFDQMAGKIKRALKRLDQPLGSTFPSQTRQDTRPIAQPTNLPRSQTAPRVSVTPRQPQNVVRAANQASPIQTSWDRRQADVVRAEQISAQRRADEITRRRHQQWLETHDQWPDPISQYGIAQAGYQQRDPNANRVQQASTTPQTDRQPFQPTNSLPTNQQRELASRGSSPVRQASATEQLPPQGNAQYQYLNAQPAPSLPGQPTVAPNVTVSSNGGFVGDPLSQSPLPHFGAGPTSHLPVAIPLDAPVPNGFPPNHIQAAPPAGRLELPSQNSGGALLNPGFQDRSYPPQPTTSHGHLTTGYSLEGTELRQRAQTATERALEMKAQNEALQETIAKLNLKIGALNKEIEFEQNNVKLEAQKTQEVQALLEKSNRINALLRESVARSKVKVEELEKEKILIQEDANKALREIETTLDAVLLNTISSSRDRQLQETP